MGYLICENCGGYYELQPGEYPDDFEKCQCGGKLQYRENLEFETALPPIESLKKEPDDSKIIHKSYPEKSSSMKLTHFPSSYKTLIIGFSAVMVLLFKLHVFNYLIFYLMRYTSHSLPTSTYITIVIILSFLSIFIRKYIKLG